MNTQRTLELRKDKAITDATLQSLTNMKFEFEDYRIENQGTKPSRFLLDIHAIKLSTRLPDSINSDPSSLSIPYAVVYK